eukprot:TRINITY_DN3796_c0_g1_i2.p1 TRINITY_DN3796_c0_g1~~TRINITY_DN3796_c0_g1_i2.p1  ORF type:complete len:253 (-),score=32.18 TRINITY_DN3796_c0_g1_i2:28-786(-)
MAKNIKFVVLDIEGTTTPITFVKDVLFPFAKERVHDHLHSNWKSDQVQNDVKGLLKLAEELNHNENGLKYEGGDKDVAVKYLVNFVHRLIDEDRKVGPLKQLQGNIWEKGYADGHLKGTVYPDVIEALDHWKQNNVPIYIYSSGSVHAQKLLFRHSDKGDLLPYFKGHFDTTIGSKIEHESYVKIATNIKENHSVSDGDHSSILFVTDNILEALAASKAGYRTALSVRPGNAPLPDNHNFLEITSFLDLISN